ncbi:MAG: short-chain fatty acyl-CoA regulator family protein [Rhodospirillales bacterium]
MARFPIGQRIRHRRLGNKISQTSLARDVGISAAYLNLIEHDKRQIGGALLGRIAACLDIDRSELSGAEEGELIQELEAILRTQDLKGLDEAAARDMVARNADWAQALITLHRRYRNMSEQALALSDRLGQDPSLVALSHAILTQITSIRSFAEILQDVDDLEPASRQRFSGIIASQSDQLGSDARAMIELLSGDAERPEGSSPEKETDDFIIWNRNYFPALEEAVDRLRGELGRLDERLGVSIADRLTEKHGMILTFGKGDAALPPNVLNLDESAPEPTRRFRHARHLAGLEFAPLLDDLVRDDRLTKEDSRERARHALQSYAAAALLMPYDAFFEAAETGRYDIERLAGRFRGSIEQVAHRLVTLRRPGSEGIPFSFLRADPAGNISKPFSIPDLRMPRFGGACPLWALYEALGSPDRTVAQMAEMPGGNRYLFIARRVSRPTDGFPDPPTVHAIMLGCEAANAHRTVYGDGFQRPVVKAGFNCRSCPRERCGQRAVAPIRREPVRKPVD